MNIKLTQIFDYLLRALFFVLAIALLQKYNGDNFIKIVSACMMIFNILTMFFDNHYKKNDK
jgi:hypothetical protein